MAQRSKGAQEASGRKSVVARFLPTCYRGSLVFILLAQLLIGVSPGRAIAIGQESPRQSDRPLSERAQRGLSELEMTLAMARELDDKDLRVRVQVEAADMLWKVDEHRSRQMFALASEAITAPPATASPSPNNGGDGYQLQIYVLSTAIRRDPALAESLLQPAIGGDDHPGAWRSYGSSLLLHTASLLRSQDPLRAARLAIAGYERLPADSSADQTFNSLLYSMRQTNAKLSDEMLDHAISVLKGQPERAIRCVYWMAAYVFPDFRRPPAPASAQQLPHASSVRYLNLVHDSVTQTSTKWAQNAMAYSQMLTALLPYFEKYAPEKRASLEKMLEQAAGKKPLPPPTTQPAVEPASPAVESVAPALVGEAVSDPALRDTTLSREATRAVNERQFEPALTIGRQISDEFRRSRTEQQIHVAAAYDAIRRGDLDTGLLHAREISRADIRASHFSRAINTLRNRKQEKQARDLLDEAWHWTQEAARGPEKADGMLRLAGEAAVAGMPAAFQMMESVVDEINLTEFAPVWWKTLWFDPASVEGKTRVAVQLGVGAVGGNFGRSLGMLSRVDFDRAMMLARRIRMKEVSVFARLAICRDALL